MSIRLTDPLPGCTLTDGFGWRGAIPSIGVPAQLHNGQDMAAPHGTPILAAHDGTVIWAGWDRVGGGNGVQISTGQYSTLYFHMNEPATVRVGQSVHAGDVIGYVGSTGAATGPHLHFMLRLPGGDVDPMPYLTSTPTGDPMPTANEIAEAILHYPISRVDSSMGGITSLASVIASFDAWPEGIVRVVRETATLQGIDPAALDTALRAALKELAYPTVEAIAAAVNDDAAERLTRSQP